jgi:hypothetical protein
MTYKSRFYWDEETVNAYKADVPYLGYGEMKHQVEFFVMTDCTPEDGETEEELVHDLLNLIYSDYDNRIKK